jgi:POT family proton-dependent oligopeptide transporter
VNGAGVLLLLVTVSLFAWLFLGGDWTPVERKRLTVIAVLFCASALFWSAFEQAGSSLNLFAQRNSDNVILGFEFPASWYQSLNSLFIITFAAVLAWLWIRLGDSQPSSPAKFALGLILVGLGFVFMMAGSAKAAAGVKVSPLYLVATYLMHTIGELCLSPVGLSAITKLAPARVAGLMMGVWFLSLSVGNYLGGRLAAFYGDLPVRDLFQTIAIFAVVAGLTLAAIARPVARLMGGVR